MAVCGSKYISWHELGMSAVVMSSKFKSCQANIENKQIFNVLYGCFMGFNLHMCSLYTAFVGREIAFSSN